MRKIVFILGIASMLFVGCKNKNQDNQQQVENKEVNEKSHQTSVQYEGTIPCADCGGIKVNIKLFSESNAYLKTDEYLGKNQTFTEEGHFEWDAEKKMIILVSKAGQKTFYKIDANIIIMLNSDGSPLPEGTAEQYTLTKIMN